MNEQKIMEANNNGPKEKDEEYIEKVTDGDYWA